MAKKTTTPNGTDAAYRRFLLQVNLYALGLDSMSAQIERDSYALAHADSAPDVVRIIESSFELIEFNQEQFGVKATFCLKIKYQKRSAGDKLPPPPEPEAISVQVDEDLLNIKSSFTAQFHCKKTKSVKDHASRFSQSEAKLIFWPYFRQTVSDVTARMSIRPVIVPVSLKP